MYKQLLDGSAGNLRLSYLNISSFIRASIRPTARIIPLWRVEYIHRSHVSAVASLELSRDERSILTRYKSSLSLPPASHELQQLEDIRLQDGGTIPVVLHGYLGSRNDLSKQLCFVPLLSKDLKWSVQIVSSAKNATENSRLAHEKLKQCQPHTPVVVAGQLQQRPVASSSAVGKKKQVRHVEVDLQDFQCLNAFPNDINMEASLPANQRYLQIRQDEDLRRNLALRSNAIALCGQVLEGQLGFLHVETPLLFRSTPEGAREFMVPTRQRGLAYALPQSPQQFKQMLMASGVSKYYQIARCFRDEDLRADRQPEFTQLDVEMAFATGNDVMRVIESLVETIWSRLAGGHILRRPFPRLSYQEAMSRYGSDKPDLRIDISIRQGGSLIPADLISKISPLVRPEIDILHFRAATHRLSSGEARKFMGDFLDSPQARDFKENPSGAPGIFVCDSSKPLRGLEAFGFEAAETLEKQLEVADGDILMLQARPDVPFTGGSTSMGNLRLALHREAVNQGLIPPPGGFEPLWVVDFPLFSPADPSELGQGGAAGLASTHHPFTSPKTTSDMDLLLTDPSQVVGDHYDLVMNGVELGGGSRRIHQADMQRFIMERVLQMPAARIAEFDHLLQALRAGCPPHAGIALGLDRLVALLAGKDSVRDVIAFPKGKRGEDTVVKSPGRMSEEVLKRYHLQLQDAET